MPDLRALLVKKQWVPVDVNGFEFNVAYRTAATSASRQLELQQKIARLQGASDQDANAEQLLREAGEVFCEVICEWDLTLDGAALPITAETVMKVLPLSVFNAVMSAVNGDEYMGGDEKKELKPTSVATSLVEGRQAIAQNGMASYEPRGTWAQ